MFSAMLFAISIVALAQFGLYYWRAVLTGVAAQPISSEILEAVQVDESNLCGADLASFLRISRLWEKSPACLGKCHQRSPVGANTSGFCAHGTPPCRWDVVWKLTSRRPLLCVPADTRSQYSYLPSPIKILTIVFPLWCYAYGPPDTVQERNTSCQQT